MLAKKSVFIIPGFRQKTTSKGYKTLTKLLKKEGYNPILVDIPWQKSTLSEHADYFLQTYNNVATKNKYILGFSFGAVIAFLAATRVRSNGLILCSLSPYFKEDLLRLGLNKESKNYRDFVKQSCTSLAKSIKTKNILMLYGQRETKSLINRVQNIFSHVLIRNKYLIPVQNAQHNIADKRYIDTIHLATKAFL